MKLGPLWTSLGIRLGDALCVALPLPDGWNVLTVRIPDVGGFRVSRYVRDAHQPLRFVPARAADLSLPPGVLPPLTPPEERWDLDAEARLVRGCEVWTFGAFFDRRNLVAVLRAYLQDPEAAELAPGLRAVRRTTRRIPR